MSMRPKTNGTGSESSQESHSDSRWMGWTLGLLAVPVVYVLTVPPIFFLAMPRSPSYGVPRRPPTWLMVYAKPYIWATEETPLAYPLNKYGAWWRAMLEN